MGDDDEIKRSMTKTNFAWDREMILNTDILQMVNTGI